MKYLVPFLLFLTGCAHTPMLEPGNCYTAMLDESHIFVSFRVDRIFEMQQVMGYSIQSLDSWGDETYPNHYAFCPIEKFDSYVSPIVSQVEFNEHHKVTCNPIRQRPPLRITGRKP